MNTYPGWKSSYEFDKETDLHKTVNCEIDLSNKNLHLRKLIRFKPLQHTALSD